LLLIGRYVRLGLIDKGSLYGEVGGQLEIAVEFAKPAPEGILGYLFQIFRIDMRIVDVDVGRDIPPFGDIVGGGDLAAYGIRIVGILIRIDQHGFPDRVEAAVLKPCHQIGRILVIPGHEQGVAVCECLHIRHFECIGEFGDEVGITTGDIQCIGIVGVRYQLEESRPIDLTGGAELQLLVVLELLAEEQGGEEREGIAVMEMLSCVQQIARVVGAFRTKTHRIAEVAIGVGKVYIGGIYAAGAFVIAGAIGGDLSIPALVRIIGVHVVVQALEGRAQSCFQLDLGERIRIIRLYGGKAWTGSTQHLLVRSVCYGRARGAGVIVRRVKRG